MPFFAVFERSEGIHVISVYKIFGMDKCSKLIDKSSTKASTLSGETLSGESDEFLEKWRKFRPTKSRPPR